MKVSRIDESSLPIFHNWWTSRNNSAFDTEMLPPDGFIVDDICAGWLYLTNSVFSAFAWQVSNPSKSPKMVLQGFEMLVEHIQKYAVAAGRPSIFAYTNHHGLLKLYQKSGFIVGDNNMTHILYKG